MPGTVARLPWWAWSGGLFGAVLIGFAVLLVPRLGAATFIAPLVAGQMLASVAFDQFGWLGLAQRSIDLPRLLGMALLVAGVVLMRRSCGSRRSALRAPLTRSGRGGGRGCWPTSP